MLDGADKVIVALDCDREKALHIGKLLAGQAQWVKVGMTLYYAYGPSIVSEMHDMGFKVFLDLKLHDIPHQIRGAAKAASEAGADMLTLHALGGSAMIEAAREGVEAAAINNSPYQHGFRITATCGYFYASDRRSTSACSACT